MKAGELRRIARAISSVENRSGEFESLLSEAYRTKRWAKVVGVTGAPGAGKSTLVDGLAAHWAAAGASVAVLAIDPSSPYSGGAVLGDRIRRVRSAAFPEIFFRSLSSRGHVGGLNETATDLIALLSGFSFSRIIVETVGAGQSDVEIRDTADCTVVVTVPGLGDGVQAAKAGLMEIADVFVVNKADLPGAEDAARTLERALAAVYMGKPGVNVVRTPAGTSAHRAVTPGVAALMARHGDASSDPSTWTPPVLRVSATDDTHVADLANAVDAFLGWIDQTGRGLGRQRERAYGQLLRVLSSLVLSPYLRPAGQTHLPESVAIWVDRIASGETSPLEAARVLVSEKCARDRS